MSVMPECYRRASRAVIAARGDKTNGLPPWRTRHYMPATRQAKARGNTCTHCV